MSRHAATPTKINKTRLIVAPFRIGTMIIKAWLRTTLAALRVVALATGALVWAALVLLFLLASLTSKRQGATIRRNVAELLITPVVSRMGRTTRTTRAPSEAAPATPVRDTSASVWPPMVDTLDVTSEDEDEQAGIPTLQRMIARLS
jgi:hypothetical protein